MNGYFDTKGLFGTTPEELQRKIFNESQLRRAKEMQFLAQNTTAPGYTYSMLQSLEPLRQQFEQTGEDPRVAALRERATAAQDVFSKFPEIKGAADLYKLGGELARIGQLDSAEKAFAAAARITAGKSGQEKDIAYWENRLNCSQYAEGSEELATCKLKAETSAREYKRASPEERGSGKAEETYGKARAQAMGQAPELILANEQLNTAFQALKSMNAMGGIPERMKTSVQQALGKVPKDKAEFMLLTGELMYQRLKPLFGGVISEGEREAIEKIYPGIDKGAQANEAILAQLKRYYDMALRRAALYNKSSSFSDYNKMMGEMLMNPSNFPSMELTMPAEVVPPAETTTAPATPPAEKTQPTPLMPNYEEMGFKILP